jgi:uncharacterized membrane protein (UPF0127 family)
MHNAWRLFRIGATRLSVLSWTRPKRLERPRHHYAGEPVRFVLELKAGTAARDGIEEGDLLRHPAIGTAPNADAN